jgi:Flp pilus assembly protein TadB
MTAIIYNKYGLILEFGLIAFGLFLFFSYVAWDIHQLDVAAMYLLGIALGMALVSILDKRITTSSSKQKEEKQP